jgi:hypothetical protein
MKDPIAKIRNAVKEAQMVAELKEFAEKDQEREREYRLNEFFSKTIRPAFSQVQKAFDGAKVSALQERPNDVGFKVTDVQGEFWFWIEIQVAPLEHR